MDQTPLEKAKAQYPDAQPLKVKIDGEEIVILVIPPTRLLWRKFKMCIQNERTRPDAFEQLVRDCTKWPSAEDLSAMLEKRPALGETFGDAIAELAGAGLEVEKNA